MRGVLISGCFGLALALAACAQPENDAALATDTTAVEPAAPAAELIEAGQEVARMNCASCHGIAGEAEPAPGIPPLAAVAQRYDLTVLAEELAQGVHVGGEEMPKFELSLDEIDALAAYLTTLKAADATGGG